jgi:hypothetical protein
LVEELKRIGKVSITSPSFEEIVRHNLAFVDKTDAIHKLLNYHVGENKKFFSRPRKWGKSLLVDIIHQGTDHSC